MERELKPIQVLNRKWQQMYRGLAKLEFSKWVQWMERGVLSNTDEVGVYALARFEPNKIPKFDPFDKNIVYFGKTNIGKSTSLEKRLSAFHDAAFGRGQAHHAGGETYRKIFGSNPGGLYVSVCPIYWDENTPENIKQALGEDYQPFMKSKAEKVIPSVVTQLEVCLRGVYVLKWGSLPKCNKE